MRIDILTLFPELFPGPLGESIIGRAARNQLISVNAVNVRDFATDARGTVDERPYGGGPGMLMIPDTLVRAVESVKSAKSTVILTSPRGEVMNQQLARELAKEEHLILIAGHYEGVDQRVIDLVVDREISIGDFVLSSGNIAAMAIADAVVRLLPGVLGDMESADEESHSMGLLEYPQYTRPPVYRGLKVPDCLLSGDHGKVAEFRKSEAERITRQRRPDLWEKYLSSELKRGKK